MTRKQILERTLGYASGKGWKIELMDGYKVDQSGNLLYVRDGVGFEPLSIYQVLFAHDFARALFGDTCGYDGCYDCEEQPFWEQQLQDMVIADDVFKWLEEYLNGARIH